MELAGRSFSESKEREESCTKRGRDPQTNHRGRSREYASSSLQETYFPRSDWDRELKFESKLESGFTGRLRVTVV
jgi:hypothetical protein